MTYKSPLHILDSLHITPNELTPEGITRLRKKLLAEFSLSSDITIDVNGQAYTKDEILKVIDQLKEVDNLVLHKAIFSRKPLLDWLENPQKGFFPQDLAQEVLDENLENDFYQNMLQSALANYVKFHFKKRHFIQLQKTVPFIANLQKEYRYEVYDVLSTEIQVIIEEIKNARKKPNVKKDKEIFGFISEPQWTDFLNDLPDIFEGIRDNYCDETNNYTVSIPSKYKQWTFEISVQLVQTLCNNKFIKEAIEHNHEVYSTDYGLLLQLEDSTYSSGIISIIVVGIFMFFYIYSRDDSPNRFQTYIPNTYRSEQVDVSIKTPAITFYIQQIQNYQKALVKNDYQHDGQKINIMPGENILFNLNVGNKEEITDSKDKTHLQAITFKNETDYDVVILKAGCIVNRSYFVKSKDIFWIESCEGDKFYFYFGKEWRQIYAKSTMGNFDKGKRFQGYFSEPHKNTNSVFMKEYTVMQNTGNPSVILYNVMLEYIIGPQVDGLQLRENDTSTILQ